MTQSSALRHYIQLILFKAYAELKTESTRTYIGVFWWIFDPILYMAVFYLLFEVLLGRGRADFVPFLLVGLVFFRWFNNAVVNGAQSIKQGHALMQQIYLPKVIFPLVVFVTDSFKFLITMTLLLVFLWSQGFAPSASYLLLPVLIAVQIMFTVGALLLVASIIPLLPDLQFLVTHGLTMLFFLSGIFFSANDLSESHRAWFYLNPMAYLVESYRLVLLQGLWPDLSPLLPVVLVGLGFLVVAALILIKLDRRYPKIVRTR